MLFCNFGGNIELDHLGHLPAERLPRCAKLAPRWPQDVPIWFKMALKCSKMGPEMDPDTKCLKPCSKDYSLKAKWLARFPGSDIPWLFAGDLVPITLPAKL